MKKIFLLILLLYFTYTNTMAAEFDSSIDFDIRKNYNVDELPALPKVSPSNTKVSPEIKKANINTSFKTYTIKGGTEIVLISKEKISNWNSEGTKVSFLSQNQIVTKEGIIIPAGTLFKGVIVDSHSSQITGNGGLIKLNINEIYYNGIMSVIKTKVSQANSKKIFINNIKGKRKYLTNCKKAMTPGIKTYNVLKTAAKDIAAIPVINILSVIPFTIGTAAIASNAAAAPIISVFMKGDYITIPSGSVFYIKILNSNQIRG